MQSQDEGVSKAQKEKKHQEEVNRKLQEDLQAEEDKVRALNNQMKKIQHQMDDKEDQLEREKRVRGDVEKVRVICCPLPVINATSSTEQAQGRG